MATWRSTANPSENGHDGVKVCFTCKTEGSHVKTCARCGDVNYCSKVCQKDDWKRHKPQCTSGRDKQLLSRALRYIRRQSVDYAPVDLKDVGFEYEPPLDRQVLVAKIASDPVHFLRHFTVIEDFVGEKTKLFFYLDHDNPRPHFEWCDLKKGNVICIHDPFMHHFLDGQVGIRIDDACDIHIIK